MKTSLQSPFKCCNLKEPLSRNNVTANAFEPKKVQDYFVFTLGRKRTRKRK